MASSAGPDSPSILLYVLGDLIRSKALRSKTLLRMIQMIYRHIDDLDDLYQAVKNAGPQNHSPYQWGDPDDLSMDDLDDLYA